MKPMPRSPFPPAADQQPVLATCSPFVGRVGELEQIRRVLLSRRGPRGILIAGPSGIGKTRLLDEAPALAPRRRLISLHPHAEAAVSGHGQGSHRSPATPRAATELARLAERDPADAWLLSVDDAHLLGPELWPLLHEAARHPAGKLLVSVTTDGHGLPPELLALWSDRALVRMDLQPLDATGVKELTDSLLQGGSGRPVRPGWPSGAAAAPPAAGGGPCGSRTGSPGPFGGLLALRR